MPRIQLGANAYQEERYGLPNISLENWYAEEAPDRPDWKVRLVPSPGLVSFSTGGNKGRGCYQSDAVASGDIIVVYDTLVRRVASNGAETTITGAVTDDSMPVAWGASQTQLVINSGGAVYTVTGTNVTNFTANLTAAGASGAIIDVAVVNNRHLYAEDNSGRVFYSAPGDATTIEGFFTAERDPDLVAGLLVAGSNLIVFGRKKTEFWIGTGSDTIPFIQRSGYVYERGLISRRARAQIGGAGYWVGHQGHVWCWADGLRNIAPDWMVRRLVQLSAADKLLVRVTAHSWNGHDFVKVTIPGAGSYLYDAMTREWHRRRDIGDELFIDWSYDYFVEGFDRIYVQKVSTGKLLRLDVTSPLEDASPVRRVTEALVPVTERTRINNMIIEGQAGVGRESAVLDESNPECMIRVSRDGHIFESEQRAAIGAQAQYSWRTVFGPQGTFVPPVAKVQLAYSSPVLWSVYGLTYNERP